MSECRFYICEAGKLKVARQQTTVVETMRAVIIFVALVATASACCYTLQSNPRADRVPVYTWYLDTMSRAAVRPTDCVGELRPVDQSRPAALSACELQAVDYRPMDLPEIGWRSANITDAEQVLFTQPCVGFGPYKAGERASSLLLHQLSGSWVRLHLQCDDSRFGSCVHFGLQLRQAAQSRLVVDEREDPYLESCERTPSATPSETSTPSRTPTPTPTPSATPLPEYGAVYRIEATFKGGIFTAMQFGLNYEHLRDSQGAQGSHWCSVPVLDDARTHVMTTLFPDHPAESGKRSIVQWAHAQLNQQSEVQVTVLWIGGGWCRVTLDDKGALTFNGCRLFVGDQVYEELEWSHVESLDARAVPLCGTVVAASMAEPSREPQPVECSPTLGWRIDAERSLVRLRSADEYAEARVALERCSDGSERPRLDSVSDLLVLDGQRTQVSCAVDPESHFSRAYCGERLLLAVAGSSCDSIEAPGFDTVEACVPDRNAVLLV
jgi:hypothetical protein